MKIEIKMLGRFILAVDQREYNLSAEMGKQLQNLFQLLAVNRCTPLTKERIIDVLYSDAADPAGALKYAVFRLRDFFKRIPELQGIPLVVTSAGTYTLNEELDISCDVEQFMADTDYMLREPEGEKREETMVRILGTYSGMFYQSPSCLLWTQEQREYYHRRYLMVIVNSSERLLDHGAFEDVITLCGKALSIDEFAEDVSYCYLRALMGDEQFARAMSYYKSLISLYMENYGEMPSLKIRKLYTVLSATGEDLISIDEQQKKLRETDAKRGAFFCNYDIFRYIYQSEVRFAGRRTDKAFLLQFEVKNAVEDGILLEWMKRLRDCIRTNLRSNDVFTAANKRQYLVLVNCREADNAVMLVDRIIKAFRKSAVYRVVELRADVREIR